MHSRVPQLHYCTATNRQHAARARLITREQRWSARTVFDNYERWSTERLSCAQPRVFPTFFVLSPSSLASSTTEVVVVSRESHSTKGIQCIPGRVLLTIIDLVSYITFEYSYMCTSSKIRFVNRIPDVIRSPSLLGRRHGRLCPCSTAFLQKKLYSIAVFIPVFFFFLSLATIQCGDHCRDQCL